MRAGEVDPSEGEGSPALLDAFRRRETRRIGRMLSTRPPGAHGVGQAGPGLADALDRDIGVGYAARCQGRGTFGGSRTFLSHSPRTWGGRSLSAHAPRRISETQRKAEGGGSFHSQATSSRKPRMTAQSSRPAERGGRVVGGLRGIHLRPVQVRIDEPELRDPRRVGPPAPGFEIDFRCGLGRFRGPSRPHRAGFF